MCLKLLRKTGDGFADTRKETKAERLGHLDENETVDTVVSDAAIAEHTPSPHSNKVLGSDLLVGVFLCDVYVLLVPAEVQRHLC